MPTATPVPQAAFADGFQYLTPGKPAKVAVQNQSLPKGTAVEVRLEPMDRKDAGGRPRDRQPCPEPLSISEQSPDVIVCLRQRIEQKQPPV
jgi:hypothetical protein